jgi:alpha-beta hydrolase superfamily lysophospholipase
MPSFRLSPHEASDLDVILLGHSLGGLIAAEIALMTSCTASGQIKSKDLRHNIAGLVVFDAPFLRLHPHVVGTGIGRLFHRKADTNNEGKDQEDAI